MPKFIRISVGSDHVVDRRSRKSTTGMVQRLGWHVLKAKSNQRPSLGLNVGEAEYNVLVDGSCHGLRLQANLEHSAAC